MYTYIQMIHTNNNIHECIHGHIHTYLHACIRMIYMLFMIDQKQIIRIKIILSKLQNNWYLMIIKLEWIMTKEVDDDGPGQGHHHQRYSCCTWSKRRIRLSWNWLKHYQQDMVWYLIVIIDTWMMYQKKYWLKPIEKSDADSKHTLLKRMSLIWLAKHQKPVLILWKPV